MNFTKEQIVKAKAAKSAAELLEMAKKENFPMTEEEAAKIFAELHREGELSDTELDAVAGGSKGTPEPKYVVGNIVQEIGKSTFNAAYYEVLSVDEYSPAANSWMYTCLCLEENYETVKTFDSNPHASLARWSKDS